MKESLRKYPIEQAAAEHGFRAYAEPWKYGVEPDAENGISDFWLLPDFTDYKTSSGKTPVFRQEMIAGNILLKSLEYIPASLCICYNKA